MNRPCEINLNAFICQNSAAFVLEFIGIITLYYLLIYFQRFKALKWQIQPNNLTRF